MNKGKSRVLRLQNLTCSYGFLECITLLHVFEQQLDSTVNPFKLIVHCKAYIMLVYHFQLLVSVCKNTYLPTDVIQTLCCLDMHSQVMKDPHPRAFLFAFPSYIPTVVQQLV